MNAHGLTPDSAQLQSGRPKWLTIIIICGSSCGLLLLLFGVSLVFAVRGSHSTFQEADQIARQFMQEVSEKKDETAYGMTSSTWRNSASFKEFQSFVGMWRQHQGTLKGAELKGKWVNTVNTG